jgi:predicted HTH transcriptional regulator
MFCLIIVEIESGRFLIRIHNTDFIHDTVSFPAAFISGELQANRNTIKKHLQNLVKIGRLVKHGKGRGADYSPF